MLSLPLIPATSYTDTTNSYAVLFVAYADQILRKHNSLLVVPVVRVFRSAWALFLTEVLARFSFQFPAISILPPIGHDQESWQKLTPIGHFAHEAGRHAQVKGACRRASC